MNRDEQRKQDTLESLNAAGKERLRLAQLVLTAWYRGDGLSAIARGITMPTGRRMSRVTAWRFCVWLGVENGRRGKATGRHATKAELMEVRP